MCSESKHIRIVQHFVPSCRSARLFECQHLASARLLRSLDDHHLEECVKAKYASMGTVAFVLIATPIILAFVSDIVSDFAMDTSVSTAFGFFIVANTYLFELDPWFGGVIVALPYVVILAFLCWRFKVFRPMLRRAKELRQQAQRDKFMPRLKFYAYEIIYDIYHSYLF